MTGSFVKKKWISLSGTLQRLGSVGSRKEKEGKNLGATQERCWGPLKEKLTVSGLKGSLQRFLQAERRIEQEVTKSNGGREEAEGG